MKSKDLFGTVSIESLSPAFDLERSLLFRYADDLREEVHRHKWLESEKAGRDIGWDLAKVDFTLKHHLHWRRDWLKKHGLVNN